MILTAVKCYQRRLGLDVKENFVIGDAFVWGYLYKSSVKDIYSCLVKTSDTPKCTEKWSKVLAVETDTKAVFDKKKFRTTREKCLIWFQYKLLYNLLPTGRFLFQRQLVDSPVFSAKMLKKLYYICFGIAQKSKTTGLMYRDGFIPASHIVLI